jgi:hypothetical protein
MTERPVSSSGVEAHLQTDRFSALAQAPKSPMHVAAAVPVSGATMRRASALKRVSSFQTCSLGDSCHLPR